MRSPAFSSSVSRVVRSSLSSQQLSLLRRLDAQGPATKARNGWMLGGRFYRTATFTTLIAADCAVQTYREGKHRLETTPAGRALVQVPGRSP